MNTNPIVCFTIQPAFAEEPNDPDAATVVRESILEMARGADGVDLIVLPEYANACGLSNPDMIKSAAEDTTFLTAFREVAREKKAYLVACIVASEGDEVRNRAVLLDRTGHVAGCYDKLHLTREEDGTMRLSPGHTPVIFEADFGRMAVATCYDLYYPLLFEFYRRAGVILIATPSYQRAEPRDNIIAQSRTRAMDCGAYIARASYYYKRSDATSGCSGIYAPDGSIPAMVSGVGTCHATINDGSDRAKAYRAQVSNGHRRDLDGFLRDLNGSPHHADRR